MSTTFNLLREQQLYDFTFEFTVSESSAKYYIEMDKKDNITGEWQGEVGTSKLPPEEVLCIAHKLIYAVWCSYPDMVDVFINSLDEDLVGMFNGHDESLKKYLRDRA